jgi:tight adherence protein B
VIAVGALAALAALAVLVWPAWAAGPPPRGRRDATAPDRAAFPRRQGTASLAPGSRSRTTWLSGWPARLASTLRIRGAGRSGLEELAEVVDALSPPMRAGLTPAGAAAVAEAALGPGHACAPMLRDLAVAARDGEPLSSVWESHAGVARAPELRLLVSAWSLSEELGAPLAESLSAVGQVLRARQAARERLAAVTAGPRASMALLALLPLSGPVVGALFGMTPAQLYTASAGAASSLIAGCLLALGGWRWSRALLRRAVRPGMVS